MEECQKKTFKNENLRYLERGIKNLLKHIDNLQNQFGLNVVVAINKYLSDTQNEIQLLSEKLKEKQVELSLVESWEKGAEGAVDLAEKVISLCEKKSSLSYTYSLQDSLCSKIEKIATKIYGAEGVEFSKEAQEQIKQIETLGYDNFPVCIAKTQYSLSDDPKKLEITQPFKIHVTSVIPKTGAEFIVVLTGKMMTMPGLPKVPAAEKLA